mmetsp:Transcript_39419/g.59569  ORF Transcript_39419/g.59569 Transcript_39419/m.59569 type:complete len:89 (+) Transcript_39419:297-563(+)
MARASGHRQSPRSMSHELLLEETPSPSLMGLMAWKKGRFGRSEPQCFFFVFLVFFGSFGSSSSSSEEEDEGGAEEEKTEQNCDDDCAV